MISQCFLSFLTDGPDKFHPQVLRELDDDIARLNTTIWELMVNERSSSRLKENKYLPDFKKDKRQDLGNYKLINLL